MLPLIVIIIASAVIIVLIFSAEAAIGQSFYEGKTITMIAGTEPGGTLDMRTKALTHFLKKHKKSSGMISRQ
jgi:tripartite-type tricarboxylate transporter receptor subunit TctC